MEALYEVVTILFYLESQCMSLCMEYTIVQMSTAAFQGGTVSNGPIFNDSDTWIRLNLSDGIGFVDQKKIPINDTATPKSASNSYF